MKLHNAQFSEGFHIWVSMIYNYYSEKFNNCILNLCFIMKSNRKMEWVCVCVCVCVCCGGEGFGALANRYLDSYCLLPPLNGFSVPIPLPPLSLGLFPGPHSIFSSFYSVMTAIMCSRWGWQLWVRCMALECLSWEVSTLGWHITVHSESDLFIAGPEIKQCLNRSQAPDCRISLGVRSVSY